MVLKMWMRQTRGLGDSSQVREHNIGHGGTLLTKLWLDATTKIEAK